MKKSTKLSFHNQISCFAQKFVFSIYPSMNSIQIELTDLEGTLFEQQENIEHNPARLASLEDLTRSLYDLKRKHAATSVEELIEQREELAQKVGLVEDQTEIMYGIYISLK